MRLMVETSFRLHILNDAGTVRHSYLANCVYMIRTWFKAFELAIRQLCSDQWAIHLDQELCLGVLP